MKTVSMEQVADESARVLELPPRVQEALGVLVVSAKEGLLALSVGVGLGVLSELMEEEVCEVVGPKGKHDPERVAVRHGHEAGSVTLGGRRVPVERPRIRGVDGGERPLETYQYFADRDPFSRHCSSRCWLVSRPAATRVLANRSATRPRPRHGRRRVPPSAARSLPEPLTGSAG